MTDLLATIQRLISQGEVVVSQHARNELANDQIGIDELISSVQSAVVIEEYPDYAKGPCVLVLQQDTAGKPVHALWGVRKGATTPAALVTAYRPDPSQWSTDFLRRRA